MFVLVARRQLATGLGARRLAGAKETRIKNLLLKADLFSNLDEIALALGAKPSVGVGGHDDEIVVDAETWVSNTTNDGIPRKKDKNKLVGVW